jgi:predicted nucleotidyltransferase
LRLRGKSPSFFSFPNFSFTLPAPSLDDSTSRDHIKHTMNAILAKHTREIADLCRKYHVQRLEAFGSVTRVDFDPSTSDIDLIAVFSSTRKPGYADRYMDFIQSLETLLGRKVDLLTPNSIRNPRFAEAIKCDAVPIYESEESQAA